MLKAYYVKIEYVRLLKTLAKKAGHRFILFASLPADLFRPGPVG